jgi:acyl carrier protein
MSCEEEALQETASRIKRILVRELEVDAQVVGESTLETPLIGRGIGLDSMETLALVAGIENEFDVVIPDGDLEIGLFKNLSRLADYVVRRVRVEAEEEA